MHPQSAFDGSWSFYDCGLADGFGAGLYRQFLAVVQDEQERSRRLKRVGIWSLRSLSKAILHAWSQAMAAPTNFHSKLYQVYPLE